MVPEEEEMLSGERQQRQEVFLPTLLQVMLWSLLAKVPRPSLMWDPASSHPRMGWKQVQHHRDRTRGL